jgi:peroxiredoxin
MRFCSQSISITVLFGLLLCTTPGFAQDAPPAGAPVAEAPVESTPAPEAPAASQQTDPKAEALLLRAMEYMQGLDRLNVEMILSLDMQQSDQSVERTLNGEISLAGENELLLVSKNDSNETRLISDGKTLTVYNVSDNTYFTRPAPLRKQLIGMMGDELTRLGSAFVSAFLHNDSEMFEQAEAVTLAGSEEIDGASFEKVQMQFPDFDLTAWIAAGDQPLLHHLKIDLSQAMREATGVEDARAIVDAKLDAWEVEPTFETALFQFSPPEGATEEDPAAQPAGASNLVGSAAPDIELEMLGGGEMSLASHQGKDIVVLDFWATWCGPCRKGLPIVSNVTKSFEDKNVVFYAVNIEEDPAKIRTFLDAQELEIPVALDATGTAQQKYGASSIPTTVIIGKDGKVQAVHTGIGPNTEQELQEQLTTLVEGGTLL